MVVSALERVIFRLSRWKENSLGHYGGLYQDLDGNQLMIKMIWHSLSGLVELYFPRELLLADTLLFEVD
jgi:hypothetical protein